MKKKTKLIVYLDKDINIKKILNILRNKTSRKRIFLLAVFIISFITALSIQSFIKLPFSNPWSVTGPLTLIRYNPANNIVRFLLFILLPSFVIMYLSVISPVKNLYFSETESINIRDTTENQKVSHHFKISILLILFSFLFLTTGELWRWQIQSNSLDIFHDGESLGPAIDYLSGKVPYKDTLFVHGVFQDPLRSVLSFNLFGISIGAMKTMEIILEILAIFLFVLSLYVIYEKNPFYMASSVLIISPFLLSHPYRIGFIIPHRDICLFIFLSFIAETHRLLKTSSLEWDKKNYFLLFLLAFISVIAFAYSIDRGFYLTASTFNLWLLCFFYSRRKLKTALSMVAGYFIGVIGFGFAIRWAYTDFFRFTFLIMPKYKELLDGFVYPFRNIPFLVPVVIISFNIYWVTCRFVQYFFSEKKLSARQRLKTFYLGHFMEITFCMLSVFYFRNALGRADLGHVWYTSSPAYIFLIYILVKYYLYRYINKFKKYLLLSILVIGIILNLCWTYKYEHIPLTGFKNIFPLDIPDEKFIPTNYQAAISFFKDNLKEEDGFFTMTSEPIWYYFINRPCPSRFNLVWIGAPYFYQNEIVADLERQKVKYILYKNNNWPNAIDGVDNEHRFPIIMNYIKKKYKFFKKIYDQEIWVRE